ncbi:hypothetical protein DPSP01_011855 [Paraphaeosphaeria sporulosa]
MSTMKLQDFNFTKIPLSFALSRYIYASNASRARIELQPNSPTLCDKDVEEDDKESKEPKEHSDSHSLVKEALKPFIKQGSRRFRVHHTTSASLCGTFLRIPRLRPRASELCALKAHFRFQYV